MRHCLAIFICIAIPFTAITEAQNANSTQVTQSTWNGLHFGSTAGEVRQSLAKQGMELRPAADCSGAANCRFQQVVSPDWKLQVPASESPLQFKVRLLFSPDDHLELIHLLLLGHGHSEAYDAQKAASSIKEQMIARYGTPATQSGVCDTSAFNDGEQVECSMIWRADSQNVKLTWLYFGNTRGGVLSKLTVEINYTQLQSGL